MHDQQVLDRGALAGAVRDGRTPGLGRGAGLAAFLAAGLAGAFLVLGVPAASMATVPESFADLAAKVTPAVVNISSTHDAGQQGGGGSEMPFDFPKGLPSEEFFKKFFEDQGRGQQKPQHRNVTALGSGFIIDPSGYVVTNHHVIEEATDIQVILNSGEQYKAKLIGQDQKTDLALL